MAFTVGGEGFDYRFKITIDKNEIDANLTDFPVYFDLSDAPAGFWVNVKSDGGDIRVTQSDGSTQQALEVVFITTGSNIGEIHFKGSSISSSVDTDFYIYYGNVTAVQPAASSTYGSENVWDSDFEAIWHMNEDPSGSPPQLFDSTSNARHGTMAGSMTSGDLISGAVGNAISFDGANDCFDVGFKVTGDDGTVEYFYDDPTSSHDLWECVMGQNHSTDGYCGLGIYLNSGNHKIFTGGTAYAEVATDTSGWHQNVFTWDVSGNATEAFKDGSSVDTGLASAVGNNVQNFHIACFQYSGGTIQHAYFDLDEIRLSSIKRSDDWIAAGYSNQSDTATFFTVGAQELGVTFKPWILRRH
jgi:hypothetical protein